jgi:superfamily II RNA helicase
MQIITKKNLNVEEYDIDIDQPTKGIRKYPFTLDHFQKAAVLSIGKQILV